jgi:glycosyltransferase involved in cell wall biosynthesis
VFGAWCSAVERAVLDVHDAHPADLMLAGAVPHAGLSAAWKLWRVRGVPYPIDFRDAWSRDVTGRRVAFPVRSRRGRWERKLVDHAGRIWCVNEPIRDHYARRYPHTTDRLRVVRNGSDLPTPAGLSPPDPAVGLTFGYLGTAIFSVACLRAVPEGGRMARQVGPVARADAAAIYAGWDALLLLFTGGRDTTSGKIYEYMSTGLPIMSAHEAEHGALDLLDGYPLWTPPPREMTAELLVDSFVATAETVLSATDEHRAAALAHGARYERRARMAHAVRDLVDSIAGARADQAERRSGASPTTGISA